MRYKAIYKNGNETYVLRRKLNADLKAAISYFKGIAVKNAWVLRRVEEREDK